ncbi:hypothetical protein D1AOALGA4SA_9943 [Olavius algarvensis Delta 1 endosymbiont]|nr:hypothetical protein D1AOALGA4SA_9943 [Olavius algarvensis Delta 1 endosymbiont]
MWSGEWDKPGNWEGEKLWELIMGRRREAEGMGRRAWGMWQGGREQGA